MSFASQFAAGASIAKGLVETYRNARMNGEIEEVAKAKAEQSNGFTAEQGVQLQAAASAGDHVNFDAESKAYSITPKLGADEMGPAPFKTVAQQGVTDFLGKRTAGAMTDDQVNNARTQAMSGVIGKYNPVEGMRLAAEGKRGEREDQRFALETKRGEREERLAADKEAETEFGKKLDAQVGEAFKARLANPDGSARAATVDDYLAASQIRAGKLTEAGKIEKAGEVFKEYQAQAFAKIKMDDAKRQDALGRTSAALAAGDLNAVKDFYNEFVPDGAKVTDVARGANGQITIKRVGLDGSAMPDSVMKDAGQLAAGLASFKDPMAVYNWSQNEFRNNLALRADARAGQSLALQGAGVAESRANRNDARGTAQAKAAAGVALYKEQNPNATPAQLKAVELGIMSALPKAPAGGYKTEAGDITSLLGTPAVDTDGKPVVDVMTGRQAVNRNVDREKALMRYMKQNNITDTNEGLQKFMQQEGGAAGAPVAKFKTAAEAEAQGKAGKLQPGDKVEINGRIATYRP